MRVPSPVKAMVRQLPIATSPTSSSTGLRLPTLSEMNPQPILPTIPPTWKTAKKVAATTTERWTSSYRERAR